MLRIVIYDSGIVAGNFPHQVVIGTGCGILYGIKLNMPGGVVLGLLEPVSDHFPSSKVIQVNICQRQQLESEFLVL